MSGVVYPVGLRLLDRRVVVVGGGQVAHRRVAGLLEARARVTVVSPEVTPALEALVAPGSLTWVRRRYRDGDLDGAWYAVAATDDPAVNAAVAGEAERLRVFCARADDRSASSVWTPAVGRQGDLVVGVHGGGDPQRAVGVRDAVVAGLTDGSIRDRAAREPEGGRAGSVVLVGGGPGDPGLITVRGQQAVAQADVVLADHLAPQSLLASLPPEVEVIDASKLPRGRSMAQEQINALLVEHALAGRRVVRLKGGDPFVFGRGMEELEACVAAGVPVEVVPGVTSAIGVPGLAGIPVTHRGLTHEFVVVSGHVPPGHPASLVDWPALGRLRGTVVVLMGVDTAGAIAAALVEHGRAPDTPVAVVADGSTATQRVVRTTLAGLAKALADEGVRPPAVWVVGEVVRLSAEPARSR
ncbi:uroporphyrin-III C-methyltransferase/precorrin-2 dehydrogenase/sirohydrochlorin ferrochelatase [Geodermatophilus tzadiensis]|uniref:Uroporphyrin-III C-methyltransferase/precorrin-2 dehydrogenase/sirohydrochlorin ferrochelatase n=1 Tax=Geodermatophilus tzadiensis TaxID=1137988 RepID=A0A2T0TRW3_9ACTN|nr:uroporphyrinogen-III C-methyltransferase [Geodermatophilus tzadiensis]PRY48258.1 uroporphyrin-III C-methyltransferase/precorrin-2 dehydrogenase/sirohydrochlorin ferrochelatase [Geodermatophilus tzadiensis]